MFLRCKVRRKDGKQHRYWSVVENTRVAGGRVVQRHVLYLGEINDTQELAWRRSIAVLEDGAAQPRTLTLFPEDRCEGLLADASIVRVKLSELRLRRPRQWGACWLALLLWRELELDLFWSKRLGASRKGTECKTNRPLCFGLLVLFPKAQRQDLRSLPFLRVFMLSQCRCHQVYE
jgi:hypothetical protein